MKALLRIVGVLILLGIVVVLGLMFVPPQRTAPAAPLPAPPVVEVAPLSSTGTSSSLTPELQPTMSAAMVRAMEIRLN